MEMGHSPDASSDALWLHYWIPGPPPATDLRMPGGAKAATALRVMADREYWKQAIPVTVHRCKSCGYLESYARRGPDTASE